MRHTSCVAVCETLEEAENEIRTAMKLHLDSMREDGDEILEPNTRGRDGIRSRLKYNYAFLLA
jgi:predicted RNase H-like HicB family nuclease